jgi:hypothetical protein
VNLHEDFPKDVNKVLVNQPSNQGGGGSNPPRSPRYFRLPMVHLSRPPLPPTKPYRQPFNYVEYVKDSNLDAHVRIFKAGIKINNETNDGKFINLFNFTFRDIMSGWCNNYLRDY